MSYATARYTGNGVTDAFAIPFPYLLASHVKVYLAGVLQVTGYTIGGGLVTFDTAPASGVVVMLRRDSSVSTRLVDYVDGSPLSEAILDLDSKQAFYLAQESADLTEESVTVNAVGVFDADGIRITDVGAPTADTDAATKGYVDALYGPSLSQVLASAAAAAASESAAATHASSALLSAQDAAIDADAAAASAATALEQANLAAARANLADDDAIAAAASAGAAATSETNASNSASAASTSASNASTSASNASTSASNAAASASAAATSASSAASSANSAADSAADALVSVQSAANYNRNLLANGDMVLNRGGYGAVAAGSAEQTAFACDCWHVQRNATAFDATAQRLATDPPAGFQAYLRATVVTGNAGSVYLSLVQTFPSYRIESLRRGVGIGTLALTFKARASVAGSYTVVVTIPCDTSGMKYMRYGKLFTIDAADTWQDFSFVLTATKNAEFGGGPDSVSIYEYGAAVRFVLAQNGGTIAESTAWGYVSGEAPAVAARCTGSTVIQETTGFTFDVTGVQLMEGSVALPFQKPSRDQRISFANKSFQPVYSPNVLLNAVTGVKTMRYGLVMDEMEPWSNIAVTQPSAANAGYRPAGATFTPSTFTFTANSADRRGYATITDASDLGGMSTKAGLFVAQYDTYNPGG